MANNSINSAAVPLAPAFGGTGVANTGTFTVGGNTAFSGAFTFAGTLTGNTAVTFPTSGTLATTAGASGIVNSGTANQIGYYATSGTTISGLTGANGSVLVTDNTGVPSMLANPAATGRILQSANAAIPAWSTATYPATTTANRILYSSGANVVGEITTANSSILVTDGSGVPSISGTLPFTVPVTTGGTGVTTMTTAYAPVISGTTATGALQVASTGLSTSGNILTSTGSSSLPTFQAPLVKVVNVPMTAAQWNGMNATPFEIIPSPGSGFCLLPLSYAIFFNYGNTNSFSGGGAVTLQWGTTAAGLGTSMANTMPGTNFIGSSDSMSQQTIIAKSNVFKSTFDGLSVCLSNQTAAFTGGTNNTFNVVVSYITVATGL